MEGDLRLVHPTTIANWRIGRLEVFFEGSWSQVCSDDFGSADADVACRQLGLGGAGTPGFVASILAGGGSGEVLVYPEVALTSLGCNGTETRLLDCPGEAQPEGDFGDPTNSCFYSRQTGLALACVTEPEEGTGVTVSVLIAVYVLCEAV